MRDDPTRETREALSLEAVDLARRIGEPHTLAYVLDGRYAAVWWPENLDERVSIAEELLRLAYEVGDKERELQAHHYLSLALLERGDLPGVEREIEAKTRLAEHLRQPTWLFYLATLQATLATFQGRFTEAEELIPYAFGMGERAERSMARIYRAFQLYALRREQGRLVELVDSLKRLAREFPSYVVLRCVLGQALTELDRRNEARDEFDALAQDNFRSVPRNDEWVFAMGLLAEVAGYLNDAARAQVLYELLLPYEDRNSVSAPDACFGSISRNLGILAVAVRRWGEAERYFEAALAMNERMGAWPWVAHTQHDRARMLAARGNPGDRERAVEVLEAALATCREVGMAALDGRVTALLEELGVSAAGPREARTFMFTDVVRSTALAEAIGDSAWSELVRWHDRTLRALFREHGGEEVDHAGDGFFVAFREPGDAAACAVAIQRALAEHRRVSGFAPLVRIGLHSAEATAEGGGYKGLGVHRAARVAAVAEGEEILATRETVSRISGVILTDPRRVELKGISAPVDVVSLAWREI